MSSQLRRKNQLFNPHCPETSRQTANTLNQYLPKKKLIPPESTGFFWGQFWEAYMGVSRNKGTPKWMVKIRENPIKMDDLGGKPTIFGNTHISCRTFMFDGQQGQPLHVFCGPYCVHNVVLRLGAV